jgi:hypothetical protein
MKYQKPKLVTLSSAIFAVRGSSNKAARIPVDSLTHATHTAYEADE